MAMWPHSAANRIPAFAQAIIDILVAQTIVFVARGNGICLAHQHLRLF